MASQLLSLERSLDQFRRELSDKERAEISGVNKKVLHHAIQEIQGKLGREKGLCRLTRIEKFLHAMDDIEKLVTIFLNASDFVAFVWGPVKLALMVATTWKDCVRQLVDAYEEIANALGNLTFFHKLIQSREHLRLILEDYFSDILRFHRCVLDVFSRPDWKRIFKWAWGSFRRQVKPIIESLKRKQAMLSDDKLQSHAILKEVQDLDDSSEGRYRRLYSGLEDIKVSLASEQVRSQALQDQEMKGYLQGKLNVSKSRTDLRLESPELSLEASGYWVFSHPIFNAWASEESPHGNVLFLSGSPGSGKTTLARTIIRRQRQIQMNDPHARCQSLLMYFFFKHDDADRRSTRSMLRHIIMQVVNTDETALNIVHERLFSVEFIELSVLKDLAKDCLTSRRVAIIVLDGLDEAINNEHEETLNWCLEEVLPAATSRGCHLKILICGQRDGRIDPLLSSYPHIRLDKVDAHQTDILEYSKSQAATIRARFELTDQEEESLISKVTNISAGMFLYAKVVLSNLASMDSVQEFEDEMDSDRFPNDIDQAYDRILQRVLKKNGLSRQKTVKKILGWIICSQRPLRWREIQSRFCIDADKGICNARNLRRDSCKSICSSLVDVTRCDMFENVASEQTVNMVHETASRYLVCNGTINLMQEHVDMTLFCCRYLSSGPFLEADSDKLQISVHSGYFGFLDYAAAFYGSHAERVETLDDQKDLASRSEAAETALLDLARAYNSNTPLQIAEIRGKQNLSLAIEGNVLTIRKAIEIVPEDISQGAVFRELQGPVRYKCSRIHCSKFSAGFPSKTAFETHFNCHERPFRCGYGDCFAYIVGYTCQEELHDHIKIIHTDDSQACVKFPTTNDARERDLYYACKNGDLHEVKRFHLAGANLAGSPPKRLTPLSVAYAAGHRHVCKYLIDQGVSPYESLQKVAYNTAPICSAVATKDLEILELFLNSGHDFKEYGDSSQFAFCVAMAISKSFPRGLQLLMDRRQPTNRVEIIMRVWDELTRPGGKRKHSNDATLIHMWFRQLLPKLYDDKGMFSPHLCREEYEICQTVLRWERNRFFDAVCEKDYSFATFLMDIDKAKVSQSLLQTEGIDTPLHKFIRNSCEGNCNCCDVMIQRIIQFDGGKWANSPNHYGRLPAHEAMMRSSFLPGFRVLEHTRNLNHKDKVGRSPLHYATSLGSVYALLEFSNVNLFSRNIKGQTAFSLLIETSHRVDSRILQRFLQADRRLAWTRDESEGYFTPLHHAIKNLKVDSGGEISGDDNAVFLLTLPDVQNILLVYNNQFEKDFEKVRTLALRKGLEQVLEVMDMSGF